MTGRGSTFKYNTTAALPSFGNSYTRTPSELPVPKTLSSASHFNAVLFKAGNLQAISECSSDDEGYTAVAGTIYPVTYDAVTMTEDPVTDREDFVTFAQEEVRSSRWIPTFVRCPNTIPMLEHTVLRNYFGFSLYSEMMLCHGLCSHCKYFSTDRCDSDAVVLSHGDGYEFKLDLEFSYVAYIRYPFEESCMERESLYSLATNGNPWKVRSAFSSSLTAVFILMDPVTLQEYVIYQ